MVVEYRACTLALPVLLCQWAASAMLASLEEGTSFSCHSGTHCEGSSPVNGPHVRCCIHLRKGEQMELLFWEPDVAHGNQVCSGHSQYKQEVRAWTLQVSSNSLLAKNLAHTASHLYFPCADAFQTFKMLLRSNN